MTVQFREKARIALETMPKDQEIKVSQIIRKLEINDSQQLDSYKLKNQDLDAWVVRVDKSVRLLFTKTDQGFLILDIIDRNKEVYS